MIKALEIIPNRLGNKILNFNNLIQIADHLNTDYACVEWDGCEHFDGIPKQKPETNNGVEINYRKIKEIGEENLKEYYDNLDDDFILKPCLAQLFYVFDGVSTHDFFKLKKEQQLDHEYYNVGIHFRGGDFKKWRGGYGILNTDYYVNAIEYIIQTVSDKDNTNFVLFTDDTDLNNYKEVSEFLEQKGYTYSFGNPDSVIDDFKALSECDSIISNPSTFGITSAMMGKKDKFIIHSEQWRHFVFNNNNWHFPFWRYAFTYGGNENYYVNKIIET